MVNSMEDLKKEPTVNIVKEMTKLDYQIDLSILKYEKLRLEMVRRFPQLEEQEVFKQKKKGLK